MDITEDKLKAINRAFNRILLPNIDSNTFLFHYTSVDNFDHIIKSDGIHLRTTHYASLNDYTELYWGRKILLDVLENFKEYDSNRIIDYYEDVQITSLSMYGNSLPMWKMYGGKSGISIGLKSLCNETDDYYVLKVVYGKSEWYKKLDELSCTKKSSISQLINLMFAPVVIKHAAFEYEQEVRLVILNPKETIIQNNALRSYIHFKPEHLGCIYVGPTQNKDTVELIKQKLVEIGYNNIPVHHSGIPYVGK